MKKSELRVRWLVLFLSCVLMIGNYYCFDNPAALKSQLQQHFNTIAKDRYEVLFVRFTSLSRFVSMESDESLHENRLSTAEFAVHIVLNTQHLAAIRWRCIGRSVWCTRDALCLFDGYFNGTSDFCDGLLALELQPDASGTTLMLLLLKGLSKTDDKFVLCAYSLAV